MSEDFLTNLPDELKDLISICAIEGLMSKKQMGEDRLTNLPDEIFCSEILSRLPLKDAVRFSGVSRKWRRSWTRLKHLKFSYDFFDSICAKASKKMLPSISTRLDIINEIILMSCGYTLESFELDNCEGFGTCFHKWILWISSSDVKNINLKCRPGCRNEVSESLFLCVTLSSLSLRNFRVTEIPAPFKGFPRLVRCNLEQVDLSDQAFEAILSSCPLLKSLTLSKCSLPSNLRILSSSLTSFAVLRTMGDKICSVEAICPRLESIQILTGYDALGNVNLCLPVCVHLGTDFDLLKHFKTVKSLRKIACFGKLVSTELEHLQSFPCLEELCVDSTNFAYHRYQVAAKLTIRLPNLKIFSMNVGLHGRYAAFLCYWILKGSPQLKTIVIGGIGMNGKSARMARNKVDCALQIANNFLKLGRTFPKTIISLSRSNCKSNWAIK